MKKSIKSKWVKALRSGKYSQAQESLTQGGSYCCLGVLGKVCGLSNKQLRDMSRHGDRGILLSINMEKKTGVNYVAQQQLSSMNDSGKTFLEIADYIEKKL